MKNIVNNNFFGSRHKTMNSLFMPFLTILFCVGCQQIKRAEIEPQSAKISLGEGLTFRLIAHYTDGSVKPVDTGKFTWKSSDTSVATVSSIEGLTTGKSPGKARIYTKAETKVFQIAESDGAQITVEEKVPAGAVPSSDLGKQIGQIIMNEGLSFHSIMNVIEIIKSKLKEGKFEIIAEYFEKGLTEVFKPPTTYSHFATSLLGAAKETSWFEMGLVKGEGLKKRTVTDESVVLYVNRDVTPLSLAEKWAFLRGLATGYGEGGIRKARAIYATVRPIR